nr:uncharacterized protein I303_06235 [Kwoniella dejecticola CBS 10117]OBR83948.1 hypothetical protein I303_06235 [Kwoniella dejecticola CBS 10117]
MATSPKRMCIVTRQVLPSSFLINLRPTYFPPDATNSTAAGLLQLLPDRILTRGRSKKGKGMWVSCHNEVIDQMINGKGPHFGTLRQFPSLTIPPNLKAIVHAQLSERVLLEMECLARRSESLLPPRGNGQGSDGFSATPYTPTLRRLTNMEAASISISSPPSSGSTLASAPSSKTILALLDISALSSPSPSNIHDGTGSQQIQQKSQKDLEVDVPLVHLTTGERTPMTDSIPLYDLSALFPHSDQHIRLLRSLRRVLSMERRNKRRLVVGRNHQSPSSFSTSQTEHPGIPYSHPEPPAGADASADSAHSDILALCSGSAGQGEHTEDDRCILGYPLFIALWRLRCFLGHGWQAS